MMTRNAEGGAAAPAAARLRAFSSARGFKNYSDIEKAPCVILDIDLPDGSGIELRHDLKAAGLAVPVIFTTGNENPTRLLGCTGFWLRGVSHQAILSA